MYTETKLIKTPKEIFFKQTGLVMGVPWKMLFPY